MTNNSMEKMKQLIEDKKKKSSQQGLTDESPNKKIGKYQKAFKNLKRGGTSDK